MNKAIQKIFQEVPARYETINHLLTMGMDIIWRKKAARYGASFGGKKWLDVCSGTGEMAAYLRQLAPAGTVVYATDFCWPMLEKLHQKKEGSSIHLSLSDVTELPFKDGSFDLVTISFAVRNINVTKDSLASSLREFFRVLKKGGRLVLLETSQPKNRLIRRMAHFYIGKTTKQIGQMISGSKKGYAYLSETIPRFYNAKEFAEILKIAGFADVSYKLLLGGVAAIHVGVKKRRHCEE